MLTLLLLACGSGTPDAAGAPSALHGDWYSPNGRLLHVSAYTLGDFESAALDGTWANDTFLFANTSFSNRGSQALCDGSMRLVDGAMVVDVGGACSDLDGTYSRTPDGPRAKVPPKSKAKSKKPRSKVKASPPAKPRVEVDPCERYVDCVCDIAIEIRHRGNDDSYMASCDVARVMADLGTKDADCEQALVDMEPWFQGIEMAHPRVQIPSECRN